MVKSFSVGLFVVLFIQSAFGYKITIKEKLIGILQKSTIIENVEFIEINDGYLHVEVKDKKQVFHYYSIPCDIVVNILEDTGENIPFNCDDSTIGTSTQLGEPVLDWKDKQELTHWYDVNGTNESHVQEVLISEGRSHRMELSKRNIKVEKDVVIIEVNSRRTNIQSTLIKSYWLCGYAMAKNNLFYPEIRVILNIEKKANETLVTIAKGKDVIKLGQENKSERISFRKFLEGLKVYRKE